MKRSTHRLLTTHTGSLPRPSWLSDAASEADLSRGVAEVVEHQRSVGLDIVNDGEVGKVSYATYVIDRLSGFGGVVDTPFLGKGRADLADFDAYRQRLAAAVTDAIGVQPYCVDEIRYVGEVLLTAELERLAASSPADGDSDGEVFCTAASPGVIARYMPNRYYASEEEYLFALADAMKHEYEAIISAGFVLQLDCPDLTAGWHARSGDLVVHRRTVAERLSALDHATRDISPDRMRLHLCWGNYEGPHHHDLPVRDIIDLVLASRPVGVSFEGANPRHEHEWATFADLALPDDAVLIPGVIDSTTNYIEHPEVVAQRLIRYAEVAGRERVIGGTDCGFATFAVMADIDPDIAWAKLAALAEGARLASERLWRPTVTATTVSTAEPST